MRLYSRAMEHEMNEIGQLQSRVNEIEEGVIHWYAPKVESPKTVKIMFDQLETIISSFAYRFCILIDFNDLEDYVDGTEEYLLERIKNIFKTPDKVIGIANENHSFIERFNAIFNVEKNNVSTVKYHLDDALVDARYILKRSFKDENARLKDIANSMQEMGKIGGWELDVRTMESYWTKGVYEIYAVPYGTPLNKFDGVSFYASHHQDKIEKCVKNCIEKGTSYDEEFDFINNSGKHLVVRSIGRAVYDENGKVALLRGSFQDITEQKFLENSWKCDKIELENKNIKIQEANIALENFVKVASHDLKAPIRHIEHLIKFIKEDMVEKANDEMEENFQLATKTLTSMKYLVDELLKYSSVNNTEPKFETVDTMEVMEEVLELYSEDLARIELKCEQLPQVNGDKFFVKQIFQNLLGNALKFSGKVTSPKITITTKFENDKVIIIIADNGIGIAKAYQSKIFQPFERLHTNSEYQGSGLGLSICKKAMEKMSGSITVKSESEQGAAFILKFN